MAATSFSLVEDKEEDMELLVSSLPISKGWHPDIPYYKCQGYWFSKVVIEGIFIARKTFIPPPNSVLLATFPKCGTTWFIALLFTTINRTRYNFNTHPLLTTNPQECVPWLEIYARNDPSSQKSTTSMFPLFKTHTPPILLPESLKSSTCPVVYVSRNPMDAFVSLWHFFNTLRAKDQPLDIKEAFDMFCQGIAAYGPYWDHVLSYWKASLEMPNKVLFVRYEDMKLQPNKIMKKLAKFVGCPFTLEEEQEGMIEKIVEFCSFKSLTSFKVNQDAAGKLGKTVFMNSSFFRKGEVGDYKNYLTDEMINHLKEITRIKFEGSGLDVIA